MSVLSTRFLVFVTLLAFAGSAYAQPQPGAVGVFADPEGTLSGLNFPGGGAATFYVVAFDLAGDPQGYEFGISIPDDWFIQNAVWWGTEPTVDGDARNARVASGACLDGSGTLVLAEITVATFYAVSDDFPICIGPSDPSRFDPPGPGYVTCDGQAVPFGYAQNGGEYYPDGCLLLNPSFCYPRHWALRVDDVLAPAGSPARVPVLVERCFYCKEGDAAAKTDYCGWPTVSGLEFTAHYDPSVLGFDAVVAGPGFESVPLEATVISPGTVEVRFAYPAGDPAVESIVGGDETKLYLDFQMSESGGTSEVRFENARLLTSEGGVETSFNPITIIVSDDPSVKLEPSTFGAIKARY